VPQLQGRTTQPARKWFRFVNRPIVIFSTALLLPNVMTDASRAQRPTCRPAADGRQVLRRPSEARGRLACGLPVCAAPQSEPGARLKRERQQSNTASTWRGLQVAARRSWGVESTRSPRMTRKHCAAYILSGACSLEAVLWRESPEHKEGSKCLRHGPAPRDTYHGRKLTPCGSGIRERRLGEVQCRGAARHRTRVRALSRPGRVAVLGRRARARRCSRRL